MEEFFCWILFVTFVISLAANYRMFHLIQMQMKTFEQDSKDTNRLLHSIEGSLKMIFKLKD